MADLELLGEHVEIVRELRERLDKITHGDPDIERVVILRGESGCGKSRIIRELYAQLCAVQPQPSFWPPLEDRVTVDDSHVVSPLADRKLIGPNLDAFVWAADSLPSFGWWAFNCERFRGTGITASILSETATTAKRLLPPLVEAKLRSESRWDRLRAKFPEALDWLRGATADELSDVAIDGLQQLMQVAVPGAGTLAKVAWRIGMASKRRADALEDFHQDVSLGEVAEKDRNRAADEVASMIRSVSSSHLPGIVVVEDAHWMNDDMYALLSELARPLPKAPVLVILTTWPEGELQGKWGEWLDGTVQQKRAVIHDVPRLGSEDLTTLLRHYAPKTSDSDAQMIVQRFSLPLMLRLWLTSRITQRAIRNHHGRLTATRELLSRIPRDLKDTYRQRWDELPQNVRDALVAAMSLVPNGVATPSYLRDVVVRVVEQERFTESNIREGLQQAADPVAWASEDNGVDTIREALMADTIREQFGEYFLASDIEQLQRACVDVLRQVIDEHSSGRAFTDDSREAVTASEWLVSLVGSSIRCPEDFRAVMTQGRQYYLDFNVGEAVTLFEAAYQYADKNRDVETIALVGNCYGLSLERAGAYQRACAIQEKVLELLCERFGEDDSATLKLMHNLANSYSSLGRIDEALELRERVVEVSRRVLGEEHPDTLGAMNNLAVSYRSAGRQGEALELLERVVEVSRRVLGEEHPDTLGAMNNLAVSYRSAGRQGEALELLERVVEVSRRVLGEEHPDTLTSMGNLANSYSSLGRIDEALELRERVVEVSRRVLGEEHPDALTSIRNLAVSYSDAGRYDEAMDLERHVVDGCRRVLGEDHPHTLMSMKNLVVSYRHLGRYGEAADLNERVVEVSRRVLGDGHPDTARAIGDQGLIFEKMGDYDNAILWYNKAMDFGYIGANLRLGILYYESGDIDKAEPLLRKSAESGSVSGAEWMGALQKKRGDSNEALKWFRYAAGKGSSWASKQIRTVLKDAGRLEEALPLYEQASRSGDVNATEWLAQIHQLLGNEDQALTALQKAQEMGSTWAQQRLDHLQKKRNR